MGAPVIEVEVESDGSGSLEVRWEQAVGNRTDGSVAIGVGPSPDPVDHAPAVTIRAGERSARLTGLPAGRLYVSVTLADGATAVVAAERRLPFEGVLNFRDVGGYPVASGGRTRWGSVFRSDALHHLTPVDLVAFEQLGVRAVFDLRHDDERAIEPNPMESLQLAIIGRREGDPRRGLAALQQAIDGERRLHESYIGMLELSAPLFGQLLTGLAELQGAPAVVHCAGGKDRTGMSIALLLSWLGVDRETIVDDYELTRRWRPVDADRDYFDWLVAAGTASEAAEGLMGAPRWVMSEALAVLDRGYGGIEAYLRGPGQMTTEALGALREALIR